MIVVSFKILLCFHICLDCVIENSMERKNLIFELIDCFLEASGPLDRLLNN